MMPYRFELPPTWWFYDTVFIEIWQVEEMVRQQYPDIYRWLITASRQEWWLEWDHLDNSERTMLVTVWVTFEDMADAALFRIFFSGHEVP